MTIKKAEQGVSVEIKTITPACAKQWLGINQNFRPLTEDKAIEYASMIIRGEWQLNGESIKFNDQGEMVDGQHRCRGVVLANLPIESVVVYGIKSDENIDRGKNRTLAQILAKHGIQDSSRMAAAIQHVFRFQNYGELHTGGRKVGASPVQAIQFIEKNPKLIESYREVFPARQTIGKVSIHAAMHYLFAKETDFELATEFYRALIKGAGLSELSPIYHLRERLIRERNETRTINTNPYAGLIVKAWNLWVSHKEIKSLRFNYEETGMPKISGFKDEKRPISIPPTIREIEIIKKGEIG